MTRITGIWRADFKIRKKADVSEFMDGLAKGIISFQDLKDKRFYYTISKDKEGRVSMGYTRYGRDPLTAPPIVLDASNLVGRIYAARKTVNARFFE